MFVFWWDLILADPRWAQFYQSGTQGTFTVGNVAVSPAPGQ